MYVEVTDDVGRACSCATAAQASTRRPSRADRKGIAESIDGRMERAGGRATIVSSPGEGTEVELHLPEEAVVTRRVVLVDDHDLFLAGVTAELGDAVEVVGQAGSVAEAVPLITELDPDVVLLDVHLPDGGGDAIINAVAPERPGVQFLALSVSDAAEDVIAVIRAGARGYVTKTISGDGARRRDRTGRDRRRRVLAAPRRLRARHVPRGRAGRRRRRARPAHPTRAGGAAADRARLHVQGDRRTAAPVREDGREPRLERPAQAAALDAARARALGDRSTDWSSRRRRTLRRRRVRALRAARRADAERSPSGGRRDR